MHARTHALFTLSLTQSLSRTHALTHSLTQVCIDCGAKGHEAGDAACRKSLMVSRCVLSMCLFVLSKLIVFMNIKEPVTQPAAKA